MKKRYIILAVALLLILAIIIGTPYLVFNFIFGRPSRSTKVPKSYMESPHYKAGETGIVLLKETLPCEDVYITSRDGLKLHGYCYPNGEEPKKFVIGVHGYRSYSRPEYAPYVEFYRSLGYSMLLPDDRAHAPSEGEYIGFGVLDRLDCVDWCKYIVETYGEDVEILLHGVSMGGATVVAASGEADLPEQVKGIVSDCAFTSPWEVLHYQLGESMHLPADLILPKVEKLCVERAGFDLHSHTALEQVKNAKVPMLFVHGAKDTMVPPHMVQELYEACPTEKRLLVVEEAAHGESIAFAREDYQNAIRELFGI